MQDVERIGALRAARGVLMGAREAGGDVMVLGRVWMYLGAELDAAGWAAGVVRIQADYNRDINSRLDVIARTIPRGWDAVEGGAR